MNVEIQSDTICRALRALERSPNVAFLAGAETDDGLANVLISEIERLQLLAEDTYSQTVGRESL